MSPRTTLKHYPGHEALPHGGKRSPRDVLDPNAEPSASSPRATTTTHVTATPQPAHREAGARPLTLQWRLYQYSHFRLLLSHKTPRKHTRLRPLSHLHCVLEKVVNWAFIRIIGGGPIPGRKSHWWINPLFTFPVLECPGSIEGSLDSSNVAVPTK